MEIKCYQHVIEIDNKYIRPEKVSCVQFEPMYEFDSHTVDGFREMDKMVCFINLENTPTVIIRNVSEADKAAILGAVYGTCKGTLFWSYKDGEYDNEYCTT